MDVLAGMKKLIFVLVAAYAAATVLGPIVIGLLKKEKASQTEREAGPESHKKKGGTPTMGGFIFLIPFVVLSFVFSENMNRTLAVVVLTVGCAVIGFLDDYIKVVLKRNLGLRAWQKIVLQCLVTALFAWLLTQGAESAGSHPFEMIIPFTGGKTTDLGILKYPALLFITLATVNGTNLTDGVDGLSASVTAVVAGFFSFLAVLMQTVYPTTDGMGAASLPVAFLGGLLGYLFYNVYPGRVMMGDTGSLALGGFVVGMSYILRIPLFIPLFGVIYAAEVISVVLQVSYFKMTHGKRLFRMSPLHHHFELGGWSETRVVNVFTTVTVIGCAVALWGLL